MARIDLYPQTNSKPSEALAQTGTLSGSKVGADTFIVGGVIGSAATPADYDEGEVQYTNPTTEVYIYKKAGVTVKTVTITYTSSAKDYISGWTIA